jgi:hypothetical protein
MKKLSLLISGIAGLAWLAIASPVFAAEHEGKELTISGEAKCAKCALKETAKCQTVIQTEGKDGKAVTYYLADNEAAKKFHEDVCTGAKKVNATGTVKTVDGKKELTVTKIALAK